MHTIKIEQSNPRKRSMFNEYTVRDPQSIQISREAAFNLLVKMITLKYVLSPLSTAPNW